MTCKDCIHYDVCIESERTILEFYGEDDAINFCSYFKDKSKFIELPCSVGTDLYRIDFRSTPCHRWQRHKDEWYCQNILHCYLDSECDCGEEYYIFEMKNADAMTILGNEKYFGTRIFLTQEAAQKKLEELK